MNDYPAFTRLNDHIRAFCRKPRTPGAPNLRFGHLTLPPGSVPRWLTAPKLLDAIDRLQGDLCVLFVVSPDEQHLVTVDPLEDEKLLSPYTAKIIPHDDFLAILPWNRAADGHGPNKWREDAQPEA
ncbi:hypothetical protein NM208_g12930 [Fusarium decemcellulare]|uniref:Uncharacterized protein n=1 Tax=Fusarium decemcellulare TaxID=57161 RepID=A0ACC1RPF1_9HYPO|nr:hypothetical protein NM208_g12930 [Fusarium decemcellulare]